jgi:glyoxylate reductase
MTKPRVFVTRIIPEKGLELIRKVADAEIWPEETPPPYEVLLAKVQGIEGMVTLLTDQIDAQLMDAAGPKLKVISQMAVGYDNIDIAAASERGISVGHTPGVLTETTADFAFALLMTAARRIVEGVAYVREGRWQTWGPTLLMGSDVHGATVGLVGFGRIGQAMARRAAGFGMRILFFDPSTAAEVARDLGAEPVAFDELLQRSDFVSLHVPLTGDTEHMIGARELALMKSAAILVNTARGAVVDSQALYQALKQGTIAYAALDVTEPEPIESDNPLLGLENCIIVPHIASSSRATRTKMATMAAANLVAGLKGERLPHCVNPQVQSGS